MSKLYQSWRTKSDECCCTNRNQNGITYQRLERISNIDSYYWCPRWLAILVRVREKEERATNYMDRVVRWITCILENPKHFSIEDFLENYQLQLGEKMYSSFAQAGSSMVTQTFSFNGTYTYSVWKTTSSTNINSTKIDVH